MLHVHHADRADLLVGALAEVLGDPPADPFAPEVVAVHSRGIERWIAQRLAHHLGVSPGREDGVAARIRFPFPGALVGDAVARATGTEPAHDPWRPDRLVWPLLDVVDAAARDGGGTDLLGPLRAHVVDADGTTSDRRLGAVRRVAELFDRYAVHRPAMLTAWAAGDDRGGDGDQLPERWRWQPALWRAVRDRIGTASTAERLSEATAAIAAGRTVDGDPLELDLPDRLAVFGVTALSATSIEVLAALAEGADGRDVHLMLLHPSPTLWRRIAELTASEGGAATTTLPGTRTVAATGRTALPTRDDDPTADAPRDPLLAAWGRDARELQLVAASVPAVHHDLAADLAADLATDLAAGGSAAPSVTLLARLQDAVRDDRPRRETDDLPALGRDDRSVQLHRCHGPTRQVEVLRDVLLHLLADDPTLEPRDVVVLCPDIETFAPLIEAVFGAERVEVDGADDADVPRLRVQLADRSLRSTNPLLRVAAELLDVADSRVTASDVVDLCTRAPVRRRFELDEDDLGQIDAWLTSTGVRWGLDADHRDDHGVPTDVNTWRTGLDRLLTGVAVADERLRTTLGVVPEDDVEGDGVELAGRVAELLARLDTAVRTMRTPRPVGAWLDVLTEAVGQLCEVDPDEGWQEVQLGRAFADVRDAVRDTAADAAGLPLSLHEVRGLLADRLAGAPSRAAHRTGDITVCTLVPMRSVPHRVVVLLGMDDEVFPRRTVPDGDDLLSAAPLVGDRDPRTEDRQLLLDALLAAGDHLVVLTTGRDGRTGEARPPAVPIGELLDVVDRTVRSDRTDGGGAAVVPSTAITVDHPLQGFDPRCFAPGGLAGPGRVALPADRPFGFDRRDLDAAEALAGERVPAPPFLPGRLAPTDDVGPLPLRELTSFLHHPVKALLDQRLDVRYPRGGDVRDDAIPVALGGLSGYDVGDRLLQEVLAGRDPDRWLEVERARGTLPPGDLADADVAAARSTVDRIVQLAAASGVPLGQASGAVAIDLALPGGTRLVGAVAVVGDCRRAVAYSRLSRKARLSAWVELLALTAARPDRPWRAVTLGREVYKARNPDGDPAVASMSTLAPGPARELGGKRGSRWVDNPLGPPDGPADARRDAALELLDQLVQLRASGLCGPLLLPCETAGEYAETAWGNHVGWHGQGPRVNAGKAWSNTSGFGRPGEDQDHAHRLVLGPLTVDELFDLPPEDDERGPGWDEGDLSRLGRLGRRVWWPLLAAEEVEHR